MSNIPDANNNVSVSSIEDVMDTFKTKIIDTISDCENEIEQLYSKITSSNALASQTMDAILAETKQEINRIHTTSNELATEWKQRLQTSSEDLLAEQNRMANEMQVK